MKSSKLLSSGLSKMTLSGNHNPPMMVSSTSGSSNSHSCHDMSLDEATKIEEGSKCASAHGNYAKGSFFEDPTNANTEVVRSKTSGGTRKMHNLKQGKTLSTSMEIAQIQKELKRGEMVQGTLKLRLLKHRPPVWLR